MIYHFFPRDSDIGIKDATISKLKASCESIRVDRDELESAIGKLKDSCTAETDRLNLETKQTEKAFSLKKADLMKLFDQSNTSLDQLVTKRNRIHIERTNEIAEIDEEIRKVEANIENILENQNKFNTFATMEIKSFFSD
jgi:DNA repair exonuclease SbcCD ATPase subunit